MTVSREEVMRALAAVRLDAADTATKSATDLDLVASGRLSEIVVDPGGRVMFSIAATPAEAASLEPVRQAAEAAVRAVPGVVGALVSLTSERVPSPASTRAQAGGASGVRAVSGPPSGPSPQPSRPSPNPSLAPPPMGGPPRGPAGVPAGLPGVRHVVAVASGKGGVGKSTTACNLALGLHALGLRVGLLDADIYGPSIPKLMGLSGKPEVREGRVLVPMEGYGLKVMSIGFLVAEEAAMIWRGPMVMQAITQMLREVAWGELDVLVVDMPPGTGDAQLTMAQVTPLAGAVIVSTPQDLALIDARRGVAMFKRVSVPILGIVENMATFVCPHCGGTSDIFGHGGARAEAARLGVPFLGEVPLTMAIRETSDAGRPVVALAPDGPQAALYRGMAATLRDALMGTEAGAAAGAPAGRRAPRIVIE